MCYSVTHKGKMIVIRKDYIFRLYLEVKWKSPHCAVSLVVEFKLPMIIGPEVSLQVICLRAGFDSPTAHSNLLALIRSDTGYRPLGLCIHG